MGEENKSFRELMYEAYNLSLSLAYETITHNGHYFDVREEFSLGGDCDKIFSWVDGLMHKYYDNISLGRCSLDAKINFDIAKAEDSIIADIAEFKALIKIYGEPKVLSKENLRARGYRGEMAGYTKEEEREYNIQWCKDSVDKAREELNNAKTYDQKYYADKEIIYCENRLKELLDS